MDLASMHTLCKIHTDRIGEYWSTDHEWESCYSREAKGENLREVKYVDNIFKKASWPCSSAMNGRIYTRSCLEVLAPNLTWTGPPGLVSLPFKTNIWDLNYKRVIVSFFKCFWIGEAIISAIKHRIWNAHFNYHLGFTHAMESPLRKIIRFSEHFHLGRESCLGKEVHFTQSFIIWLPIQ